MRDRTKAADPKEHGSIWNQKINWNFLDLFNQLLNYYHYLTNQLKVSIMLHIPWITHIQTYRVCSVIKCILPCKRNGFSKTKFKNTHITTKPARRLHIIAGTSQMPKTSKRIRVSFTIIKIPLQYKLKLP